MSGVKDDCFIHYYIQQQNTSIAQSETFLPSPAPESTQWRTALSPLRVGLVGAVYTELRHSDRNLRTAWFEKEDFKIGI